MDLQGTPDPLKIAKTFIQNHPKLFITEKRRNKASYLSQNFIRLKFLKKTNMPNPVKSLSKPCHLIYQVLQLEWPKTC